MNRLESAKDREPSSAERLSVTDYSAEATISSAEYLSVPGYKADATISSGSISGATENLDSLDRLLSEVAHSPSVQPRVGLPEGTQAGDYLIQEIVGKGAFGTVYRAVHPLIGKEVAVKVLDRSIVSDPQLEQRFIREAMAVNRIRHPNIVDIFGFGELATGQKYYIMELLRGETLSQLMKREGPLPLAEATKILRTLAVTLDAAHAVGILHRDLKPANIFLHQVNGEETTVKLLDFGVAKVLQAGDSAQTNSGMTLGTPAYMPPEQCLGETVSAAADIYALGVVAYEVLSGQRPFSADSARELIAHHLFDVPAPASEMNSALPPQVDPVLACMLAKTAEDRPKTAVEAIEALAAPVVPSHSETAGVTPQSPEDASPSPFPSANANPASSRVGRVVLAGALGVGLLGIGAVWFALSGEAPAAGQVRLSELPAIAEPPKALSVASASATLGVEDVSHLKKVNHALITFEGVPPGAVVISEKGELGSAEQELEIPLDSEQLSLRIEARGFQSKTLTLTPDSDQTLLVKMEKSPKYVPRKPVRPVKPRAPVMAVRGELEY